MKLKNTLIVFDLETTGTWVEKDRIVEIAMIKLYPDGKREEYLKKINPDMEIPREVSELIGITNEDVKDAPHFKDVASEIVGFLGESSDLGGFNLERFDLPILLRHVVEAGLKFSWHNRNIYDAQKVYHINERRDLSAAYRFYCNKEHTNAHSAFMDAEITLEVLQSQVAKYADGDNSIEMLKKFEYDYSSDFFDKEKKFRWWNKELYPMFGKYGRRYSLKEIAKMDSGYLKWLSTQDFPTKIKELLKDALADDLSKYEKKIECE